MFVSFAKNSLEFRHEMTGMDYGCEMSCGKRHDDAGT